VAHGRPHSVDDAGPAATLLDIRADLTVGDGGRFFGGERAGHPVRTVLFSRSIENGPIRAGSPEYDAQWGKLGPERTGRQCGSPLTPYARPNAYAIVIWPSSVWLRRRLPASTWPLDATWPPTPALRLHGPTWRRSPSLMERVEAGEPSSEIERVLAAAMRPSYGSFATRTTPPRAWGDARRTRDRI